MQDASQVGLPPGRFFFPRTLAASYDHAGLRRETGMGKKAYLTILTGLVLALAYSIVGPTNPAHAAAVRIMPLGDSITGSPGCWRALLWNRLVNAGHTDIDFVGTLGPQGCSVAHDGDNEGHGGFLATNVADQNQLPGWLSAARPDVVLMHFGTNDVWSNRPTATILAAFGKLVDQMRASNANMKILVAQIIPMNPSTCGECAQRTVALNAAIPGWAAGKSTAQSPIVVVDQWTGFSTAADTYDGVHPNAAGDKKMSDRWFPALAGVLGGGGTPSPTPTPTPTVTTPPPTGGCSAAYKVANSWQGGFQGEVTVRNAGQTTLPGWTVRWSFTGGEQVTQSWNTTLGQSGAGVTAKNVGWNGSLAPGATATFGFLASTGGAPGNPALTCAAG
ncbi:cellulose binding domain-containing protein [Streptosporangium soli]|nr:cellulose binding domain-containing protein [Streptosporangium sp. KLBMP 9127]